jgi:hypothetical protein
MTQITIGFSDAARTVSQSMDAQSSGFRCSETFGLDSQLREELAEVWGECQEPNWDGYKGQPISRDTLRQVYYLLEEIPTGIAAPSLSAHPDGAIAMEWYKSKNRQIVLSVIDGEIHYAAKCGANRHHGSFAIVDGWPKSLLSLISKIAEHD